MYKITLKRSAEKDAKKIDGNAKLKLFSARVLTPRAF
jgi:hypothetical protein